MRIRIGLFGLAVHAALITLFLVSRMMRGERFGGEVLSLAALLLVSSFAVYALVVPRYVARREGMQRPVIIDSLIGILSELLIFTAGGLLFGVLDGIRTLSFGAKAGAVNVIGASVLMNILWVYATFMVQIIVLGNLCGLVGWLVLKRFPAAGRP